MVSIEGLPSDNLQLWCRHLIDPVVVWERYPLGDNMYGAQRDPESFETRHCEHMLAGLKSYEFQQRLFGLGGLELTCRKERMSLTERCRQMWITTSSGASCILFMALAPMPG